MIEIGNALLSNRGSSISRYNQVAPQLTPAFTPFHQMMVQTPIYDPVAAQFCAQCGTARLNALTTYCTSCGHVFVKI